MIDYAKPARQLMLAQWRHPFFFKVEPVASIILLAVYATLALVGYGIVLTVGAGLTLFVYGNLFI